MAKGCRRKGTLASRRPRCTGHSTSGGRGPGSSSPLSLPASRDSVADSRHCESVRLERLGHRTRTRGSNSLTCCDLFVGSSPTWLTTYPCFTFPATESETPEDSSRCASAGRDKAAIEVKIERSNRYGAFSSRQTSRRRRARPGGARSLWPRRATPRSTSCTCLRRSHEHRACRGPTGSWKSRCAPMRSAGSGRFSAGRARREYARKRSSCRGRPTR